MVSLFSNFYCLFSFSFVISKYLVITFLSTLDPSDLSEVDDHVPLVFLMQKLCQKIYYI